MEGIQENEMAFLQVPEEIRNHYLIFEMGEKELKR